MPYLRLLHKLYSKNITVEQLHKNMKFLEHFFSSFHNFILFLSRVHGCACLAKNHDLFFSEVEFVEMLVWLKNIERS